MFQINEEDLKPIKKTKFHERYEVFKNNEKFEYLKIFCNDPEDADLTKKELENYQNLIQCHNCFTQLIHVFHTEIDNVCILYHKHQSNLENLIEKHKKEDIKFTLQEAIDFFYHLARGLKLLHDNGLLNCHITSKNILFDGKHLKFSMIRLNHSLMKDISKWNPYLPKDITTYTYNSSSDIYSLAAVFFEVLTLKNFFQTNDYTNYQFDNTIYPKALTDMIIKMLDANQNKRPSIKDVCNILKTLKPNQEKILLFQDILYNISRFLQPHEFVKKVMYLSKHYYTLGSKDEIWKYYFNNYTFLCHLWKPTDYGVSTYKQLFGLKTVTLKTKSKNVTLSKDLKKCTMTNKKEPMELAQSIECIKPKERFTVRIKYNESVFGCYVGLITENNLKVALECNDPTILFKYIRYMRDGSIGGMRLSQEKIGRTRLIDSKLYRVFFKIYKGDYLTIHVDRVENKIYYIVNDNMDSFLELSELIDLASNHSIYLLFSGSKNQGYEICNNYMKFNEIFEPKKPLEFSKSI